MWASSASSSQTLENLQFHLLHELTKIYNIKRTLCLLKINMTCDDIDGCGSVIDGVWVLRARRNEKDLKVKPATSFKYFQYLLTKN